MKEGGYKTESAIAKYLQLDGDPYDAVLMLEKNTDRELVQLIKNSGSVAKLIFVVYDRYSLVT